jgi:hypothetical protein
MKCSRRYFAGVSAVFALLLAISTGALNARDLTPLTLLAAQTAKPKCINTCRARYRDCETSGGLFMSGTINVSLRNRAALNTNIPHLL